MCKGAFDIVSWIRPSCLSRSRMPIRLWFKNSSSLRIRTLMIFRCKDNPIRSWDPLKRTPWRRRSRLVATAMALLQSIKRSRYRSKLLRRLSRSRCLIPRGPMLGKYRITRSQICKITLWRRRRSEVRGKTGRGEAICAWSPFTFKKKIGNKISKQLRNHQQII